MTRKKIILAQFVRPDFCKDGMNKPYPYMTHLDLVLGDLVIVDSPYGMAVVKIVSLDPGAAGIRNASKWVIQKVDMDAHLQRQANEAKLAELHALLKLEAQQAAHQRNMQVLGSLSPQCGALVAEIAIVELALSI